MAKRNRRDRYGRYRGTRAIKPWKNNNPNWGKRGKAGSARKASSFKAKKSGGTGKKVALAAGTALLVGGAAYGGYRMGQQSRASRNQAGIVPSTPTPKRSPVASPPKVRAGKGSSLRKVRPVPGITSTNAASAVMGSAKPATVAPVKTTGSGGNTLVQAGIAKVQSIKTPDKVDAKSLVAGAVVAGKITSVVAAGARDSKREMESAGFVEEWDPYRKKFSMVEHDMASPSQAAEAAGRRMLMSYSPSGPAPKVPGTVVKPNAARAVPVEQDKEAPKKIAPAVQPKATTNSQAAPAVQKPVVEPKVSIPRPSTFSMAGNNTLIPQFNPRDYEMVNAGGNRISKMPQSPVKKPQARPQNPVPKPAQVAPAVETAQAMPKAAQSVTAGVKVDAPKKRGRPKSVDSPDVLTPEQTAQLRSRAQQLQAQRKMAGDDNPLGMPKPVAGVKIDSAPQTKPSATPKRVMSVADFQKVAADAMKSGSADDLYEYLENQGSSGVQLPREARGWLKQYEAGVFEGQEATTLGRQNVRKSEAQRKEAAAEAEKRKVDRAKKKRQAANA